MSDYLERLRGLVGQPNEIEAAEYPISEAMIHHWCDAMGDRNPAYTNAEFAAASSYGHLVAPPTMLQAWTMPGIGPRATRPGGELVATFEEAGVIGVVATNCDQEYLRDLGVGERVTETVRLESLSELKKTALGEGHFVTNLSEFRTADGELVATMRFRMLFFRPAAAPGSAVADAASGHHHRRPRPAITADSAFFWEGVSRGELLLQ